MVRSSRWYASGVVAGVILAVLAGAADGLLGDLLFFRRLPWHSSRIRVVTFAVRLRLNLYPAVCCRRAWRAACAPCAVATTTSRCCVPFCDRFLTGAPARRAYARWRAWQTCCVCCLFCLVCCSCPRYLAPSRPAACILPCACPSLPRSSPSLLPAVLRDLFAPLACWFWLRAVLPLAVTVQRRFQFIYVVSLLAHVCRTCSVRDAKRFCGCRRWTRFFIL